jgi:hypothetical protein
MELLGVIRRWHHREHMPIREIERRTGLSRNTIRKDLRSDAVEVKFKVPERPSRLDPFADKLSGWLEVESGKGRKVRRTARRLHADLVALGYDGSDARVAAFIRTGKRSGQLRSARRDAVCSCRWPFNRVRRFSSTGARIGRRLQASGSSCRRRTPSYRIVGRSRSGPTGCRPTRCCSTPWPRRFVCWVVVRAVASSTICGLP